MGIRNGFPITGSEIRAGNDKRRLTDRLWDMTVNFWPMRKLAYYGHNRIRWKKIVGRDAIAVKISKISSASTLLRQLQHVLLWSMTYERGQNSEFRTGNLEMWPMSDHLCMWFSARFTIANFFRQITFIYFLVKELRILKFWKTLGTLINRKSPHTIVNESSFRITSISCIVV